MQKGKIWLHVVLMIILCIVYDTDASAQEPDSTATQNRFADTAGGYGYMYLSTTCFECNPKGSAFYKKFVIISGIYKAKDFYSAVATRSVGHFKKKFEKLGYFKNKMTQTWKSPKLFPTLEEIIEYRNDLIAKLKSENYVVVTFDDQTNTEDIEPED